MPSAFPRTVAVRSALVIGCLFAPALPASAQAAPEPTRRWELLFSSGALVLTGAQRHAIKDTHLSTAQLSYVVRSRFALTTMVGWARSRDLASAGDPKLDSSLRLYLTDPGLTPWGLGHFQFGWVAWPSDVLPRWAAAVGCSAASPAF